MTTVLSAPDRPASTARRRIFSVALGLWRLSLVVLLLLVVSQPITMGLYLSGQFPMIGWHGSLGSAVAALALLVAGLSVVYALAGGRASAIPLTIVLFLACGFQIGMGYERELAVHVPLGVGVVCATMLLTVWSWTGSAARFRERGRP